MLRAGPGLDTTVSRRRVLAGGVALAVFGTVASACSSPPPPPPAVDELEAQLTSALRDNELATAAAVGAPQQLNAALTEAAAERTKHAQALSTEIARLAITPTSTTSTSAMTTTPTTAAAAGPPPPLADVVRSFKASADSATQLAATSSGYRAGLLGSIAAACTASYSIALASSAS